MKRIWSPLFLVFCLVALPAFSTVAVLTSDADLTRSSRVILEGEVLSAMSQWEGDVIYSYIEVSVDRVLKGRLKGSTVVVKQIGGTVGETSWILHGSPAFKKGERVLLFLDTWDDGALRVSHLFMGKYDVVRDAKTGKMRAVRKAAEGVEVMAGPSSGEITQSADLAAFRTRIGRLARQQGTREGAAIVEIPHEVRAHFSPDGGPRRATGEFNLLVTNNRFHRWHAVDNGSGIGFWFNLTQAPNGNAHQSLINAQQAWNNVPTAKINLDFSGYATAGGLSADFFNAISFEDPLGQLQDPVNCGGIVAAASLIRRNDNNPREVNKVFFHQILEADVVYNNGWTTPSCPLFTNDATTKIIEEVGAHELGHAIGLGHSDFTTRSPGLGPIMRSFIYNDGRGATLGFDDEVGVTFIYPEPGNPIDHPRYFVGWHYRDWLEREPDISGLGWWASQISNPGLRPHVALAFPYSGEFIAIDPRFNGANRGTPTYNNAFVEECYERYWKRPKDSNDWVNWLNARIPNTDDDYRTVLQAFFDDFEYRSRFDPYLCNPADENACWMSGGSWNSFNCTCDYSCGPWGCL